MSLQDNHKDAYCIICIGKLPVKLSIHHAALHLSPGCPYYTTLYFLEAPQTLNPFSLPVLDFIKCAIIGSLCITVAYALLVINPLQQIIDDVSILDHLFLYQCPPAQQLDIMLIIAIVPLNISATVRARLYLPVQPVQETTPGSVHSNHSLQYH